MTRLRLLAALALAWAAGYAMRRQPPAPCPDDDAGRVLSIDPYAAAAIGVDVAELQRRSYRAGEADGRAASLGDALRLAGNPSRDAWRRGYRAGWEELALWCRAAGHPDVLQPAPGPDGGPAVDRP